MPKKDIIDLVIISSEYFAPYTATMLASVLVNLDKKYSVNINIITDDISEKTKKKFEKLKKIKDFSIKYVSVPQDMLKMFEGIKVTNHVTRLTFAKVILPDLFPDIQRVIFLDCDLIVRHDLSILWNYDLGSKCFGIVKDVGSLRNAERLWGNSNKIYYNTGVMLIDLARLRTKNYLERVKTIMQTNGHKYCIGEQDIISDAFNDEISTISESWNFHHEYHFLRPEYQSIDQSQYDEALRDPAIVHFVGQNKPWKQGTNHAYKKEFLFYYKMTPFYSYAKDIINKIKSCFYLATQNNSVVVKKYLLGLLRIKKDLYSKEIRLLGIPLMQRKSNMNYTKMKFFAGLLQRIKYDDGLNKYYVFGIKVLQTFNPYKYFNAKFNNINLENSTFKNNQLIFNEFINTNIVKNLHQKIFPPFKNIHAGQDVVIVGSGPTLNKYKVIDGAIHIGLNRTFENNSIKFDYIFAQDYPNLIKADADFYIKLQNYNCKKFFGLFMGTNVPQVPQSIVQRCRAYTYYSSARHDLGFEYAINQNIFSDIEVAPLMDFMSTAFAAFNFAIYTYPKRIYLVGIDNSMNGYYDGSSQRFLMTDIIKQGWEQVKLFMDNKYPDIEVISINPVGLKGIFKDMYTE